MSDIIVILCTDTKCLPICQTSEVPLDSQAQGSSLFKSTVSNQRILRWSREGSSLISRVPDSRREESAKFTSFAINHLCHARKHFQTLEAPLDSQAQGP